MWALLSSNFENLNCKGAGETARTWDFSILCLKMMGAPRILSIYLELPVATVIGGRVAYHQAQVLFIPTDDIMKRTCGLNLHFCHVVTILFVLRFVVYVHSAFLI